MPPPAGTIPTHIGKYEIQSVLGRGGMGIVYRARDPGMGRQVALKTLTGDFSHDDSMLKRFYREAEKTGRLNHPNIITIYDLGEHESHPFIVMEFLEGEALDSIIQSGRAIPLVYKLNIMEQICSALAHAHAHDVIHRDVKPANVMIQTDGNAKLLDFGIAAQDKKLADSSLTQVGSIIGTVPYMSPERLGGASFDGRSDVFAAGVVMFQMLTGHLPFAGAEHEVAWKIMYEKQPSITVYVQDCPAELDEIIARALEKDPGRRYATAEEMAADIFTVMQRVKEQHIAAVFGRAQELVEGPDPAPAREMVMEVLRWNANHTQARGMLAKINQRLSQRQQTEVAEQKRRLAEDAILERKYDVALPLLEEAFKLNPEDKALAVQLEDVRQKKLRVGKLVELCSDAEKAKRAGDITAALAKLRVAMELDTQDSRIRLAYQQLLEHAREAESRAKAKALLQEASKSLQKRDFRAAIALADEAELLDPSNAQIHQLLLEARNGQREEERRAMLGEIEMRAASAASEADLRNVSEAINQALEKHPSDASLLRLRLETDVQLRVYRDKKIVDGTAQSCRALLESDPMAARECVRKALAQVPGDPQLLTLAGRIEERLREQTQESRRQASMLRAREALDRSNFEEAVEILMRSQKDSYSEEVAGLLAMAQGLLAREQRRQTVSRCHLAAQEAMRAENYAAVCALIQPVLDQEPDGALEQMLRKAEAAQHERNAEREGALARIRSLAARGLHDQAVAAHAALPARLADLLELRALQQQEVACAARERERLEALGVAYRALNTQNPAVDWGSPPVSAEAQNTPSFEMKMWQSLAARREEIANEAIRAHCALLQASPTRDEAAFPKESLVRMQGFAAFAERNVAQQWISLAGKLLPKERTATRTTGSTTAKTRVR